MSEIQLNSDTTPPKDAAQKTSCCAPSQVRVEQLVSMASSSGATALRSANSEHLSKGSLHEPLEAATERMVLLSGGSFLMGTEDEEGFKTDGEGPVREVTVDPFWIDRTPVTNATFAKFIAATGYVTEAENFGWSFVFWSHIPEELRSLLIEDTVLEAPWWCKVHGAKWDGPEGPYSDVKSRLDHPVVQVSWNDAQAFCEWSQQRLPTEAEWEYAARGGLVQNLYPWGNKLRPNGEHRCNIWQGDFPHEDTGEDGYVGTCPVDTFPSNGFGLYSVAGNAWEWSADWRSTEFHVNGPRVNPKGPSTGGSRVMRGGSFLCHKSYCNRYRVAARTSNSPDSSTSNIGFRCARSL